MLDHGMRFCSTIVSGSGPSSVNCRRDFSFLVFLLLLLSLLQVFGPLIGRRVLVMMAVGNDYERHGDKRKIYCTYYVRERSGEGGAVINGFGARERYRGRLPRRCFARLIYVRNSEVIPRGASFGHVHIYEYKYVYIYCDRQQLYFNTLPEKGFYTLYTRLEIQKYVPIYT